MNLNKLTLSEQIYEILRADILTQKITLGERLTLNHLQERFGVSSTPIREALTRLTQDGLVDYNTNIGVNVISLTEQDLIELYRFMGDLDALAIRYCADHPAQESLIRELDEIIRFTERAEAADMLSEEQTAAWIRNSDRFHLVFYDYCNNRRLATAAEKLRSQLTIFSNMYERQQQPQRDIHRMHKQIYDAYIIGNADGAATLMQKHLAQSLDFALACFRQFA